MQQNTISARLKQLRNELRLSQTDFGKKIGKNYHSVMRWELGRVVPPSNVLMHISELFNVNINWLKNGDGEIFYNTNSNNVSDKENVSYVTEQPAKFGIPFFNNPLSNHKMNINEPDLYISVPETEECYFAVKAPENSAAPVLRNDIVFFRKT